jgi:TolA-binding protein
MRKEIQDKNQRRYLRLDTVFPVEFRIESPDAREYLSGFKQGFTNNIGPGGICLSVNNLEEPLADLLRKHDVSIALKIEIPVFNNPVSARAQVAWVNAVSGAPGKYLIGLSYCQINRAARKRIIYYALMRKFLPAVILGVLILLGIAAAAAGLTNVKLAQHNKALARQLVATLEESKSARKEISAIIAERQNLQAEIGELELRIIQAKKDAQSLGDNREALIRDLTSERDGLKEQLSSVRHQENVAEQKIADLDKKREGLEKANADKLYRWIKVHQNSYNGLTISFEGDSDIRGHAFLYDQSLAALANTYYSDFDANRRTFDFFLARAKKKDGLFYNAYYASDGEPAEYIIHSGPNIWLGIAIAQFSARSKDNRYLVIAEEVAEEIIKLQDSQGGVPGGPGLGWYATEHNLDAYAFFNMLYKITGKSKYSNAARRILSWLLEHTYNKSEIPVKRGRGDSTIATDTYAWSVAAVGPGKLKEIGMDPDKIMEFAENTCSVEVLYAHPDGRKVRIKGFDFAPQKNLVRGGVVSSEWTAQMVISYRELAGYYASHNQDAKAARYRAKAAEYLSSLGNMIISSPSPSGQGENCLPYATQDSADTGHGWYTPKGKSTGSLSGTAYTVFAYYNYNPLELTE